MALFPILTASGDSIVTSDGFAIVVQGGTPPDISGGAATILVPSDSQLNRGTTIDVASQTITNQTIALIDSEFGSVLSSGVFGLTEAGATKPRFFIYNADNTVAFTLTNPFGTNKAGNGPTASDYSATFYMGQRRVAHNASVATISSAGVVGTIYTLDIGGLYGMAVSADNTILYYGGDAGNSGGGGWPSTGEPIRRWDLVNNAALGTFISLPAASQTGEELLIDPVTGDLLVILQPDTGIADWQVRKYTSAGVLTWTIDLGDAVPAGDSIRLALDSGDSNKFWIRTFPDVSDTTTTFGQYRFDTAALVQSFTVAMGVSAGVPPSCPFFTSGGIPLTSYPIRRLRRFALPYEQNVYQFLSRLELILQAGNGLTTGQGSDPVVMCRVSRDGGQTWGNEMQMGSGKLGETTHRSYLNRLGRGRNFVVELSSSDPVFNSWLAVTADLETGTS